MAYGDYSRNQIVWHLLKYIENRPSNQVGVNHHPCTTGLAPKIKADQFHAALHWAETMRIVKRTSAGDLLPDAEGYEALEIGSLDLWNEKRQNLPSESASVMSVSVDDKVIDYLKNRGALTPASQRTVADISEGIGADIPNVRFALKRLKDKGAVDVSSRIIDQMYPSMEVQTDAVKREDYLKNTLGKVWAWLGPVTLKSMAVEEADRQQREHLRTIAEAAKVVLQRPVKAQNAEPPRHPPFVNPDRLEELRGLKHPDFDFSKLLKYCDELNDTYDRANYLSVVMLGRSIMNHVPPVFGFTNFDGLAAGYGKSSFKKSMKHLNESLKNIADSYLHEPIRKKEVLPNATQVNFSQDMDVLLGEVVRKASGG